MCWQSWGLSVEAKTVSNIAHVAWERLVKFPDFHTDTTSARLSPESEGFPRRKLGCLTVNWLQSILYLRHQGNEIM